MEIEALGRNDLIKATDLVWVWLSVIVTVAILKRLFSETHAFHRDPAVFWLLGGMVTSEIGLTTTRIYWFFVNKGNAHGWIMTDAGAALLQAAPAVSLFGITLHIAGIGLALSAVMRPTLGGKYWPTYVGSTLLVLSVGAII